MLVIIHSSLFAQQSPLSNFYIINPYLINPAEAGREETLTTYLSLREQWVGIEGAPSTAYKCFYTISNNLYAGVNVEVDKIHLYQQVNALATINYRLDINENQRLFFGISPGIFNNKLNTKLATVEDESDPLFFEDLNGVAFNTNVGLRYQILFPNKNNFEFGFSSNNLFANQVKLNLNDNNGSDYFGLTRFYNTYVNYRFENLGKVKIMPMILVRFSEQVNMVRPI